VITKRTGPTWGLLLPGALLMAIGAQLLSSLMLVDLGFSAFF
jgi:hypothetical protein